MLRRTRHLLAGIAIGAASLAPAFAESAQANPLETAKAYIDAYAAQDYAAMRSYYASDAVFLDPTSFDILAGDQRIEWHGPDAIISGVSAWNAASVQYRIDRVYEASGRVVFDAVADVTYGGENAGRVFRYPIVTIVTVRDGSVVEHRDYTDFNGASELEGEE